MDVEKKWFDSFDSYGKAFEVACPRYDGLDKRTQLVGSLMKLELDMHNGGFVQFFCNWGYTAYLFAVEGLTLIGASEAEKIVMESFSIVDKYKDDKRLKNLWDIPRVLSDEDNESLNKLDEKYWDDKDSIMEKMLNHFH